METSGARNPKEQDKYLLCFGEWSLICLGNNIKLIRVRINQVCSIGKGSVPRGRVYANYVSRCATERVTVLNPASFGKLVRVLFPGLKTRRLGVRGESKYHYVQFSLKDDQPELTEAQRSVPAPSFNEASFATSFKYVLSFCEIVLFADVF